MPKKKLINSLYSIIIKQKLNQESHKQKEELSRLADLFELQILSRLQEFKTQKYCGKIRILLAQINSKGIDKLENLNREIHHDRKNEKVAVIVENIQITEILEAKFVYV